MLPIKSVTNPSAFFLVAIVVILTFLDSDSYGISTTSTAGTFVRLLLAKRLCLWPGKLVPSAHMLTGTMYKSLGRFSVRPATALASPLRAIAPGTRAFLHVFYR